MTAREALPEHVSDNIEALDELAATERGNIGRHQRAVESLTRAIARPITIYSLVLLVVLWIAYNITAPSRGWPLLDAAPFFWLQGVVAFYAAAVTTCVLIAQSRQHREADRRAALEFHLNLLAEQRTTKIVALLEELRRDLPNVRDRQDPVAEAMQQEVDPLAVHSRLRADDSMSTAIEPHGKE